MTNLAGKPRAEVTCLGLTFRLSGTRPSRSVLPPSPGSNNVHQPEHLDEGLPVPPQWARSVRTEITELSLPPCHLPCPGPSVNGGQDKTGGL